MTLKELPNQNMVEFTVSNYFEYQKMKNIEDSTCSCQNCKSTRIQHEEREESMVCVVCHKKSVYLQCNNFHDDYNEDYYVFCLTCERKVSLMQNIIIHY